MSLNNFIPEVWAAGILISLQTNLVYAQPSVCNRNYEGDISQMGDTVRITSIGDVTIGDYVKDTDMAAPQTLQDAQLVLNITQQKYFNFAIDNIDKAQGNSGVMAVAMQKSAYGLAKTADSFVAGLYTDVASANLIGSDASPKTLTAATDLYPYFTQLKTHLDEADVPEDGRYVVVPPWAEAVMQQDNRFVLNMDPAQYGTLRNGRIGRVSGFDILKSNQVTRNGTLAGGDFRIMAGHPSAITFAEQVNTVEAYKPEKRFGDAVKGLNLYGAKVVIPQALALLTVTRNPTLA